MIRAILEGRKTQTRRIMRYQPPGDGYTLSRLTDSTASEDRRHILKLHWIKMDGLRVLESTNKYFDCPYGFAGDRLWVRETFKIIPWANPNKDRIAIIQRNGDSSTIEVPESYKSAMGKLKPSIFMPRWASRILLEVTSRRPERLQDITEEDAKAEGMEFHDGMGVGNSGYRHDRNHGVVYDTAKQAFYTGWEKINGKRGSWKTNPMVWVVSFKVIKGEKL